MGTPRSEPPIKVGMALPLMWLGIGNAPMTGARFGFPSFVSSAYGHSHPLPTNEPTLPLENTSDCCGFASSPVLLAREREWTVALSTVRPLSARGEFSVPFHLPFLRTAICPP